MTETGRLPACFASFPGVVLQVATDGVVVSSNGRLERELGRPVVGIPFESVLDATTCGDKWVRVFSAARLPNAALTCELVYGRDDMIEEPRSFSVLGDAETGLVWLVEHPTDARVEQVRQQASGVNSELDSAQRDLVRERSRLAYALDVTDRLATQVKAQNEALANQHEELVVMTEELHGQRRELERSHRALDEVAHGISHDLKARLKAVADYARTIEEGIGGTLTGETRTHMELLRSEVERMHAMIDGVLEYARSARERD